MVRVKADYSFKPNQRTYAENQKKTIQHQTG